jgi:hypothetical protein
MPELYSLEMYGYVEKTCPYSTKYMKLHPEYGADILDLRIGYAFCFGSLDLVTNKYSEV